MGNYCALNRKYDIDEFNDYERLNHSLCQSNSRYEMPENYIFEATIKRIISHNDSLELITEPSCEYPLKLFRNDINYSDIFKKIDINKTYSFVFTICYNVEEKKEYMICGLNNLESHIYANIVIEFRDITKEFACTSDHYEIIFNKPHPYHRILICKKLRDLIDENTILCVEYQKDFTSNLYNVISHK
jgi:hypothetical protein